MSSAEFTSSSSPLVPPDSPGSSVSSTFQNEYDELLKYAVVVPQYDPKAVGKSLNDVRSSFPQFNRDVQSKRNVYSEQEVEESETSLSDHQDEQFITSKKETHEHESLPRQQPPRFDMSQEEKTNVRNQDIEYHVTPQKQGDFLADLAGTPDSQNSFVTESMAAYSPSVDPDVGRIEQIIDVWSGDLKRNILAEISKAKIKVMENGKQQLQKEKDRHGTEVNQLQNEIEGLKELLHTYEQSIERKDQVITNLTRGLQQQREKLDMARAFAEWRIRHVDHERQEFTSRLALRHYRKNLAQKVWSGWHAMVENKWKVRVERACQTKAQEVCISLTNDYEARISSLEDALTASREEVNKLHREREMYEETMKKAFMRGVCALNLEAMTMFNEGENQAGGRVSPQDDLPRVIPQEPVFTADNVQPPMPRITTSLGAGSRQTTSITQSKPMPAKSKSYASKTRVLTAKVTGRTDAPRSSQATLGGTVPMGLNPPMSSVLVERHHPVTKQTIGQAIASRFPRQNQTTIDMKQSGKLASSSNIQSVKIVQ